MGSVRTGNGVIDGMATILWGCAWASAYEEAGGNLSGMKIEEIMPPVPLAAVVDAAKLSGMIEERNGVGLYSLLWRAAEADANGDEEKKKELFSDPEFAERFGECLAYQGTGHGISWFDDHEVFEMDLSVFFEPADTVDAAMEAVAQEIDSGLLPKPA